MSRAAALLAVALVLGGCAQDADDVRADYCEAVEQHQVELSDLLAGESPTALLTALPIFRDLAEEAPGDIADEWRVLIDAVDDLDGALAGAGVDPASYDPARPPADLSEEQRTAIERAAAGLLDPSTDAAFQAVDQHARDVCKTPLFR